MARNEPQPYTPQQLDSAVRALMLELATQGGGDAVESNVRAAAAMLHRLAEFSDGAVIRGCCTQGCCDEVALKIIAGRR
jgi:hypothetical protein